MVNNEILGGLKTALERGYSLQAAAISLQNAGYKKEEIDEAVKALNENLYIPSQEKQPSFSKPPVKPQIKNPSFFKKVFSPQPRRISEYLPEESPPLHSIEEHNVAPSPPESVSIFVERSGGKTAKLIFLIFLLILLVGALVSVFLFYQNIVDFFNGLFS